MPDPAVQVFQVRARLALGAAVAVGSLSTFLLGLASEPHFVDESAYYSQSAYADLLTSDRDGPAWFEYAGYDLPPLPKYLIGWTLRAAGFPRPHYFVAYQWYKNTSARFETPASLTTARIPSALLGAVGCVGIYAIGTLAVGPWTGTLAALLLTLNPLYRMLARRAMSDVPAEAFLLVALALGLWGIVLVCRRRGGLGLCAAILAGASVGLSVLSKLNGVISGVILAAWAGAALIVSVPVEKIPEDGVPPPDLRGKGLILLATILAGFVSVGLFVVLNPFLTARPATVEPRLASIANLSFLDRAKLVAEHRVEASKTGQRFFPDDALLTLEDKVKAVVVQGFGRFGPFGPAHADSRVRFDPAQDRGAWIWLPLVALGWLCLAARGRSDRQAGRFPLAWLILIQAFVATTMVVGFIPLAWDRYYISIQPGSCLAASAALTTLGSFLKQRLSR